MIPTSSTTHPSPQISPLVALPPSAENPAATPHAIANAAITVAPASAPKPPLGQRILAFAEQSKPSDLKELLEKFSVHEPAVPYGEILMALGANAVALMNYFAKSGSEDVWIGSAIRRHKPDLLALLKIQPDAELSDIGLSWRRRTTGLGLKAETASQELLRMGHATGTDQEASIQSPALDSLVAALKAPGTDDLAGT